MFAIGLDAESGAKLRINSQVLLPGNVGTRQLRVIRDLDWLSPADRAKEDRKYKSRNQQSLHQKLLNDRDVGSLQIV